MQRTEWGAFRKRTPSYQPINIGGLLPKQAAQYTCGSSCIIMPSSTSLSQSFVDRGHLCSSGSGHVPDRRIRLRQKKNTVK